MLKPSAFSSLRNAAAAILFLVTLSGCGGSDQGRGTGPVPVIGGTEYHRIVTVDGRDHDYYLYVPATRLGDDDVPLVLSLHGGGSNAVEQELLTRLRVKAVQADFAVLTPNGYYHGWNAGSCCVTGVDHVKVINAMLDDASALNQFSVDQRRIFALGHSNGGMMTYRLACELSDRIAAIASNAAVMMDHVASTPPVQVFNCQPGRPVPVLAIFGTADRCTPYEGGASAGVDVGPRPAASETIDFWRSNNGCSNLLPTRETMGAATCTNYGLCLSGADVQLCTIEGGGHVWPGTGANPGGEACGGSGTTDLQANDRIWDFFKAHPLR
jgi:polyhydroxybutyrate depolymerase